MSGQTLRVSTSGDWLYLFLKITLGIKLFEIRPQVLGRLFVLNPSEYHFGAGDLRSRILDIICKSLLTPHNARILIGIGIAVTWHTTGVAAVKAVEFGSDTVRCTRTDLMTNRTLLEHRRALPDILRRRYNIRKDGERGRCEEVRPKSRDSPRPTAQGDV